MHVLIVGMTEAGKTTLAKMMCEGFKKRGLQVAVLDPLQDQGWKSDFITTDASKFLAYAKTHENHMLFVDEGATALDKYDVTMRWLATTSRHKGHSSHFIAHGVTDLNPVIRKMCSKAFIFATDATSADMLADDWNQPGLRKLEGLKRGEFYIVARFSPLQKGRIDFKKKIVEIVIDKPEKGDKLPPSARESIGS